MKQLRQRSGIRAEEVAYKLDIALSTIRNWEQGRTMPKLRVDQFETLLKLYGCSFDDLALAVKETRSEVVA